MIEFKRNTIKALMFAIRKKHGLSKKDMASFTKIPKQWYSMWEDGFDSAEYDRRARFALDTYRLNLNHIQVRMDMLIHKLSREVLADELDIRKRKVYYYRKYPEKLKESELDVINALFEAEFAEAIKGAKRWV